MLVDKVDLPTPPLGFITTTDFMKVLISYSHVNPVSTTERGGPILEDFEAITSVSTPT